MGSLSDRQLAFLAERGMSLAEVIEFARLNGAETVAAVEKKKTAGAERMRRYRENRVASGLSSSFDGSVFSKKLKQRDGEGCVYCGSTTHPAIDHMMPICQGGTDDIENLAIACRFCNSKKAGRTPAEAEMVFMAKSAEAALIAFVQEHQPARVLEQVVLKKDPTPQKNPPLPSPPKGGSVSPPKGVDDPKAILGEVLSAGQVAELVAHRKAKRAPITAGAARGLVKAFREFGNPTAALEAMLVRGWTGFNAAWLTDDRARGRPPPDAPKKRGFFDVAREAHEQLASEQRTSGPAVPARPDDDDDAIWSQPPARAHASGGHRDLLDHGGGGAERFSAPRFVTPSR